MTWEPYALYPLFAAKFNWTTDAQKDHHYEIISAVNITGLLLGGLAGGKIM